MTWIIRWFKSLWWRYKFWRAPTLIAIDPAIENGDYTTEVFYKIVDGIIHVVEADRYKVISK